MTLGVDHGAAWFYVSVSPELLSSLGLDLGALGLLVRGCWSSVCQTPGGLVVLLCGECRLQAVEDPSVIRLGLLVGVLKATQERGGRPVDAFHLVFSSRSLPRSPGPLARSGCFRAAFLVGYFVSLGDGGLLRVFFFFLKVLHIFPFFPH